MTTEPTQATKLRAPPCERCGKAEDLCLCAIIKPIDTKHHVFILQHPQEPDKQIGTAKIANLALKNSSLLVALSKPNLKKALGREDVNPSRWGVLYLGSGIKKGAKGPGLYAVNKSGEALPRIERDQILHDLEGIIFLDGTWSQAKALWWRNAWLLKCRRLVLQPKAKSLYGHLRKEPRGECLSTIETIGETLAYLDEKSPAPAMLKDLFKTLLDRFKARREKKPA